MIDFNTQGLTSGYVSLHNSTNESAWQNIRLPIYCINGKSGPTTLVLGGMHGDEYEGPIAIENLIYSTDHTNLCGRLILLPTVNVTATIAGKRLTPEDGLNLNRVFPGYANGSLTQRIAHMVTHELIPLADNVIDLHSGGQSLKFAPSTLLHDVEGPIMLKALKAAKAFGAPFTVLLKEEHADVMIDAVVEAAGKVMIASELGGSGILTSDTVTLATQGLKRCLAALDHYQEAESAPATQLVRLTSTSEQIVSDDTLIFAPMLNLGDRVSNGDILGYGHLLDRINQPPQPIKSGCDGWLLCISGQGLVKRGDVMALIAQDADS